MPPSWVMKLTEGWGEPKNDYLLFTGNAYPSKPKIDGVGSANLLRNPLIPRERMMGLNIAMEY